MLYIFTFLFWIKSESHNSENKATMVLKQQLKERETLGNIYT